MTTRPDLVPIEMNKSRIHSEVLTNIIKMLTNRGLLDKDKLEDNITKLVTKISDIQEYVVHLDNPEKYYSPNTKQIYIKIIKQKIKGISKQSPLGEFLSKYKSSPKIVVVENITQKAHSTAVSDYPFTEIFEEFSLMIDIYSHMAVPVHELLSEEESQKVLEEYMVKKREMPRILSDDAMVRYFNAPIDRLFRIIRTSETSSQSIYYRRVVPGLIK